MKLLNRPRRNRKDRNTRELLAECQLNIKQYIYPVFICEGRQIEDPIKTLPGQNRLSADILSKKINIWKKNGLQHYALFPQIPEKKKDAYGKESLNDDGLLASTIKKIKDEHPDVNLITDVALDPYSSDGHDGVVENGKIVNDLSVDLLAQMAVKQAEWGTDWVAPSDMMDGRVRAIRLALETNNFIDVSILAYSAKYASSFYGPFRDALQSAPKTGNKKTYQMDPRNSREALREALLDIKEGADMIMVKPGLPYLDIIQNLKKVSTVPVAAYHVSGEYTMLKAAADIGALNEETALIETMTSFKRAGADVVLTYYAPLLSEILMNR